MPENSATLESTIEQRINKRTYWGVQNLSVQVTNGHIEVHGRARTYYVKTLALAALREVLASTGLMALRVDIQVV